MREKEQYECEECHQMFTIAGVRPTTKIEICDRLCNGNKEIIVVEPVYYCNKHSKKRHRFTIAIVRHPERALFSKAFWNDPHELVKRIKIPFDNKSEFSWRISQNFLGRLKNIKEKFNL